MVKEFTDLDKPSAPAPLFITCTTDPLSRVRP